MSNAIKLNNDYWDSSGLVHKNTRSNITTLKNILNYAQILPPGDASTGTYWQGISNGVYVCWGNTDAGRLVLNKPFIYGYYLVMQNNFTPEPIVIGFSVIAATEIYILCVNWNGAVRWGWTKLFS